MANWRTCFPVTGARKNDAGVYITTPISETVQVIDAYARLSQVPELNHALDIRVKIDGYHEVFVYPTRPEYFMVNYATGRVYFHESQESAYVNARYAGQGSLVAVDEINWLWENLVGKYRSDYFVQLMDTPNTLVPGAFMQVDSTGSRLENAAATVARSYSGTTVLPNFSGESRVKGGLFDVLTLYEVTTPNKVSTPHELTSSPTGADVTLNAGSWAIATGKEQGRITVDNTFNTGVYNAIEGVKFKEYSMEAGKSEIRVLMIVDGDYYTYTAGGWQFRSSTLPSDTEILGMGNLPHELETINPKDTRFILGRVVSFCAVLKSFGHRPTLSGTLVVSGYTGGAYKITETWGAAFDTPVSEWVITAPAGKTYLLTSGSGHDEITCTCDTIDFKDVKLNESVEVAAPIRTMLNVLKLVNGPPGTVNFPPKGPGWGTVTSPEAVPISREFYPYVATGYHAKFHSPTTLFAGITYTSSKSALCDFGGFPVKNVISGLQLDIPSTSRHPAPMCGMLGPAGQFTTENKAALEIVRLTPKNTSGFDETLTYPGTFGGWFKHVAGISVVVISTPATYWASSITVELTRNRVRVLTASTYTEVDYTEGEWVHIVVSNLVVHRYLGSCPAGQYSGNADIAATVTVNGVSKSCSGSGSTGCVNYPTYSAVHADFTAPCVIGLLEGDIADGTEFLCEQAFFLDTNVPDNIASELYRRSMIEINALKSGSRAVFHASIDNFPTAGGGVTFDTAYIPENWNNHNNSFLFAFFDGSAYYTIHPMTHDVIGVSPKQSFTQLKSVAASISTLRAARAVLASGRFNGMKLVVISQDMSGKRTGWGFPATLKVGSTGFGSRWVLVKPPEADIAYTGTAWSVTNKAATADFKLAVLGGNIVDKSAIQVFTGLKDCPVSIDDIAPKTLVAHNGIVNKRIFLHPYMRGDL